MSLELCNVSHRFGRHTVLSDLSLRVEAGDVYGLIGHNGAGKSTALRIALGLLTPQRGTVRVEGFDARRFPREARARVGGQIEEPAFQPHWSGRRNLAVLARLQGVADPAGEARERLDLVGLTHAADRPFRTYSQGMKARLAIAQAVLGDPAVVLLDEPTNGLDPEAVSDLRTLLQRLAHEQQVAVLVSSHLLAEMAGVCTRVGIVKEGRLLVESSLESLLASSDGRYRLETTETSQAQLCLAEWNVEHWLHRPSGAIEVTLGARPSAELVARLVSRGIPLGALIPVRRTLEEVYLEVDREGPRAPGSSSGVGEAGESGPDDSPAEQARVVGPAPVESNVPSVAADSTTASSAPVPATAGVPSARRAPAWPLLRAARYELGRLMSGRLGLLVVILPGLFGAGAIALEYLRATGLAAQVEAGELISTTQVTAFDAVGRGLVVALPILAVILMGLASQSISSEVSRQTVRNLFTRPLRRWHWLGGKLTALVVCGALAYAGILAATLGCATAFFDFSDVGEVLPNGRLFKLLGAEEVWPVLHEALWAPLLPLLAYISLGLCVGTWVRSSAAALAVALGAFLSMDLGRVFLREFGEREGWSLASFLPTPLGDVSFFRYYSEFAAGVSNPSYRFESYEWTTPLAWGAGALLLATTILHRKAV